MSEYIITKRTECDTCHGEQAYIYPKHNPTDKFAVHCSDCNGFGQRVTAMDADEWLLSRLAKLRWDVPLPDYDEIVKTEQMMNPRFEGDEG